MSEGRWGSQKQGGLIDSTLNSIRVQFCLIYSQTGGTFDGRFLGRGSGRGIPGHDIVRPYGANGVPKNALDLALDGCGNEGAQANSTIVGLLVTAGAVMTGNSATRHHRKTPYEWRRAKGPMIFFGEYGYQGPRLSPKSEAILRRIDRSSAISDPPVRDFNRYVGEDDGDVVVVNAAIDSDDES